MQSPMYAQIKEHLLSAIEQGDLAPGDQVPSENQLVDQFNVSRMTARRALQELAEAGFLFRTQGLGTFVADTRPMSSMMEIKGISEEIQERGHEYSNRTLHKQYLTANEQQAKLLGIETGNELFRSVIIHMENGQPVQYESRLVNPRLVPGYLNQDFSEITPNAYLTKVAPLIEADHIVEAILPDLEMIRTLEIQPTTPCLKVTRRTFSKRGVVSIAELVHPGNRYRLGSHLNFSEEN